MAVGTSVGVLSLLLASFVVTSPARAATAAGTVRSDVWNHGLHESGCPDPTNGRRVHLVVDWLSEYAINDADLASVEVGGQQALNLSSSSSADISHLHWARAHANKDTGSLWVSFHTANTDWLGDAISLSVVAKDGRQTYKGEIALVDTDGALAISYVAFRKNGTEAVVHVHNNDPKIAHPLLNLSFDGASTTTAAQKVPPNGHAVVAVGPLPKAKRPNDVWTAVLNSKLGFGGRVPANERFVVEAWPHSSDCSLPGANDDHANEVAKAGIDSIYYKGGSFQKDCQVSLVGVINKLAGTGFHVVTDRETAAAVAADARARSIDAILLGDEVDGKSDADHLRGALDSFYKAQRAAPSVPTYQGSKTTRNVGAFSGIADIQGSDAYVAACAPTMLPAILRLPLQYPYYYLRNGRDNHAPGVFWGYSQLYSDAWSYQADAPEIIAQIGQVVLSGSKALTFFQSYVDAFKQHRLDDIGGVIKSIVAVGDVVREGDVAGMTFETSSESKLNDKVMVEVIRSPEKVLVVVVNTNAKGYSNLLCHTQIVNRHWTFRKHTVKQLTLHTDSAGQKLSLGNWAEAVKGKVVPLQGSVHVSSSGADVVLSNIELSDDIPVRFFTADVSSSGDSSDEAAAATRAAARAASLPVRHQFPARLVANLVETAEQGGRFLPKDPVQFSPTKSKSATKTITLGTRKRQTIKGFGGAFTDSVASVFAKLNSTLQEHVLEALWGPSGNLYSLARLTIGGTDFSETVYNYNPPDDVPDYDQANFTIDHDRDRIIPMILRAQKKAATVPSNPEEGLRFLSSSWSPPGWMKVPYLSFSGHMRNSAKPGMVDKPEVFRSYALYLSKYISAYKAAGVPVSMMTIQNEPDSADHMFPVAYPACNFNGTGEGSFLRDYLGPRIAADHPHLKIYVHDGQKYHDVPILDRVNRIVKSAGPTGKQFIHGVAFHWYGNNLKNYQFLEALRDAYPEFDLLATEATLEAPSRQTLTTTPWKEAQKYAVDIIGDLNAGASGWIEWNVLLNKQGGPTCIGTTAGTDCTPLVGHCDAPILADTDKQSIEIRDTYYFMGHFSRHIPPASVHVDFAQGSDGTDTNSTFMATAAITPDGDTVVVVLNTDGKRSVTYQLEVDGQYAAVEIPPHGIHTLTIPATAAAATARAPPPVPSMHGSRVSNILANS